MPFLAPARQKCLGVDRLDLLRRSLMVEGHQRVMRLGGGAALRVNPQLKIVRLNSLAAIALRR